MIKLDNLIVEMVNFNEGEPKLIQHFIKVHEFAKLIGNMECIPCSEMEILEAAAIVHDIGVKVSVEKYGKYNGKTQEQEGPIYAEEILNKLGFKKEVIDRISYLIAHHHTYSNIEGLDYQILVEADFLVNMYEKQYDEVTIQNTYTRIFKTESGKKLCRKMFMIKD